jgi:hypothetical protein
MLIEDRHMQVVAAAAGDGRDSSVYQMFAKQW